MRFQPTPQRIGIGAFFSRLGQPSIVGFLQGAAPEFDPRMTPTAETKALFCNEGEQAIAAEYAAHLGVPWLYYRDRPGLMPADVPAGARAAVYAYPSTDETAEQTAARVQADLVALRGAGIPCDLVLALYRKYGGGRYTWSEQHVLDVAERVWPLALQYTVGAIWCFAQHRGGAPDGIDQIPAFQVAFEELKAASGDWQHFPTIEAPAQPEPAPIPVPVPAPLPKEHTHMEFTAISRYPIGHPAFEAGGFVSAKPAKHQDDGFIAVQRTDTGKFRYVGDGGEVEDTRDSAGAGERFTAGVGATVKAHRGNGAESGDPKGTPYIFAVA